MESNPDVLCFTELLGQERSCMQKAMVWLRTHPEEDRPFKKFLRDHQDCEPINSKHFTYYYAAAKAIASIHQPSILNLISREKDILVKFCTKAQNYMIK